MRVFILHLLSLGRSIINTLCSIAAVSPPAWSRLISRALFIAASFAYFLMRWNFIYFLFIYFFLHNCKKNYKISPVAQETFTLRCYTMSELSRADSWDQPLFSFVPLTLSKSWPYAEHHRKHWYNSAFLRGGGAFSAFSNGTPKHTHTKVFL